LGVGFVLKMETPQHGFGRLTVVVLDKGGGYLVAGVFAGLERFKKKAPIVGKDTRLYNYKAR